MLIIILCLVIDKVLHKRLLYKLQWYGIKGIIYHRIESFLSDRLQKVIIDGIFSSSVPVISGVPQGTVPILNDIPDYVYLVFYT